MSNTTSSKETTSTCANCGKGEEAGINLKACTACKLVKYCSRECQIAHWPHHKKECKKKAAELHDEKLFKQPPPREDCPICMIRLPTLITGRTYMICCGKFICSGCMYAPVYDHEGNVIDNEKCPFCRTLPPYFAGKVAFERERIKQYNKRADMNDTQAIFNLGCYHSEGLYGFAQNRAKALELWHRAGELGCAESLNNIGDSYYNGRGVERDEKKSIHYHELAAMGGSVMARNHLGVIELQAGNMDRALRHWMIATKDGDVLSLQHIGIMWPHGSSLRSVYEEAQRHYLAYLDEIKSDQRDEAAAHYDNSKYYEEIID